MKNVVFNTVLLAIVCSGCQTPDPSDKTIAGIESAAFSALQCKSPESRRQNRPPVEVMDRYFAWEVTFYLDDNGGPCGTILLKKRTLDPVQDQEQFGSASMPAEADRGSSGTEFEALRQVALSYMKKEHPDWLRDLALQMVVVDLGTSWRVWYHYPPIFRDGKRYDVLAGGPVITVDKRSLRVLHAYWAT